MILNSKDLYELKGGALTITALNAVARMINTVLDLGRAVGSSIRRLFSRNYC
ncbi:MAG: hypothetical protein HFJ02_02495 [Bacilli bacterium]|nr:hypothetical protein [Bacilli bacterium]